MKHQPRKHRVLFRRKRTGRTDYQARLEMLKSRRLRFVVRRSLKNILIQIIQYHPDGDHVLVSASTKELQKKFSWNNARRNTPAAYLVGLLVGIKAKGKHIAEAILDIGRQKTTKGSLLFAAVQGAQDAGIKIAINKDVLPSQARIQGEHIKFKNNSFDQCKEAVMRYKPSQQEKK